MYIDMSADMSAQGLGFTVWCLGFKVYQLSRSRARVDVSGRPPHQKVSGRRPHTIPSRARGVHDPIFPPPLALHPILQPFRVQVFFLGVLKPWRVPVVSSNRGGSRLLVSSGLQHYNI